ncbi:MAG: protein-L-isoaspartate O-methyltransferase [Rickettsiales bacterium]|nr:protein-L-isoaspartate O-methyltransferase [Rickettsiales bacterium]
MTIVKNMAPQNMALGQLYTNEIDPVILQAMVDVPREKFVPEHLKHCAYVDEDLEVAKGRYLLEPLIFAKLIHLAEIKRSDRVLLIGCLSGYGVAVLSKLAGHVVGIENEPALIQQAQSNLIGISDIDLQVVSSMADGYGKSSPYDVIIIAGSVDFIPELLGQQLSAHGRIVTIKNIRQRPGAAGGLGKGLLVKRVNHQLHYRELFDAASNLVPGFEQKLGFVF